ncbi:hypothetical protein MODO_3631 [Myroides odoratimimus]|nr:hypothetical protein MODO_3631 [Myroides odoratimimus]
MHPCSVGILRAILDRYLMSIERVEVNELCFYNKTIPVIYA